MQQWVRVLRYNNVNLCTKSLVLKTFESKDTRIFVWAWITSKWREAAAVQKMPWPLRWLLAESRPQTSWGRTSPVLVPLAKRTPEVSQVRTLFFMLWDPLIAWSLQFCCIWKSKIFSWIFNISWFTALTVLGPGRYYYKYWGSSSKIFSRIILAIEFLLLDSCVLWHPPWNICTCLF
jgi:hypothetical protein